MDDFPLAEGVTHAAFAIHEDKMFVCGGYRGGHPGPAVADCFVYDHSIAPGGGGGTTTTTNPQQWARLPSLPQPRAGGGMTYDRRYEILVFAGGATRPVPGVVDAVDHDTTWMLAPGTPEYGWQKQAAMPFRGNHLSFVTAVDQNGNERHLYGGGQISEEENDGNLDELYEYEPLSDTWTARHTMPFARGHSSSTLPYGCGFLLAGGAINGNGTRTKTNDISYYDIATDSWTHIGIMYMEIKTPICGIRDDYIYCTSGYTQRSHRRKLGVASTTQ
jgi:Kelch motif